MSIRTPAIIRRYDALPAQTFEAGVALAAQVVADLAPILEAQRR